MNALSTVEAAGGIVLRLTEEGTLEALMVGGKQAEPNYWGFPKGHRDPGERIEQTALREIEEETGISVELLALIGVSRYPVTKGGVVRPKLVRYYLARPIPGGAGQPDAEHTHIAWVPASQAAALLTYQQDKHHLEQALSLLERVPLYRAALSQGL